jgi:hypothetical protein
MTNLSHNEETVLDMIDKNISLQNYFFIKVSDVKWFSYLKNKGFFEASKAPSFQLDSSGRYIVPDWNVLTYLEKLSKLTKEIGNEIFIDELISIIKEVSNYRYPDGKSIDNYRIWWSFVKILLNLPNGSITNDIIDLIPLWLESNFSSVLPGTDIVSKLLPKFLAEHSTVEDVNKAELIIKHVIKSRMILKDNGENAFILKVDPHYLIKSLDELSDIICSKCSLYVFENLAENMKEVAKKETQDTFQSFYTQKEYRESEPFKVLSLIFKKLVLVKARKDIDTTKELLVKLLNGFKVNGDTKEYLIFKKLALYVIGEYLVSYEEIFWNALRTEEGIKLFINEISFGDEIKHVLEKVKMLSSENKEILNDHINRAAENAYSIKDENQKNLFKQRFYKALSHDSEFKQRYEELKTETGMDPELGPAIGPFKVMGGPGKSPKSLEEILSMTNAELAAYLHDFKSVNNWEGPTVGGLAEAISSAAREKPDKYVDNLEPFLETSYIYVYNLLEGLKAAWSMKKGFDWNSLFNFMDKYIDRIEFWNDEFIRADDGWGGKVNHKWIIGIATQLIEEGVRDDSWVFSERYLPKAKSILQKVLSHFKSEAPSDVFDYVSDALNSHTGKTISALIQLSLRKASLEPDSKNLKIRWDEEFKGEYEKLLDNKIIEAYTFLGFYLPNFYFLDKQWSKSQIVRLKASFKNEIWEAFMDGYFSSGPIYPNIYRAMLSHYEQGLEYNYKEKRNNINNVQHISLGYLWFSGEISESVDLFNLIQKKWDTEQIIAVIDIFWGQRGRIKEDGENQFVDRILDFWRKLFEHYKTREDNTYTIEDKQILSAVSRLAVFLPFIDDKYVEWLKLSAPYVAIENNSWFFIEYLDMLKDKGEINITAKYIGEIYLEMINDGQYLPEFPEDHIKSIIEYLFIKESPSANARQICDQYLRNQVMLIKGICEKYN